MLSLCSLMKSMKAAKFPSLKCVAVRFMSHSTELILIDKFIVFNFIPVYTFT